MPDTPPSNPAERINIGRPSRARGLGARFDTQALRPPAVAADEAGTLQRWPAGARALAAWCQTATPMLAVAALQGPGDLAGAALLAWADALARQLDGGTRLDALPGRAAGLAWRLRIKLNDALPWRARRQDDPWDAGWALASNTALRHWQVHWQPRRPTLVLAQIAQAEALAPALDALSRRLPPGAPAVRWLWVGGDGPTPQGLTLQRFMLDQAAQKPALAGPP